MSQLSTLELNMTSLRLYSNLRIKFKTYYVTFVNIQVKKKRRRAKKLQNQIIFMDFCTMLLKTLPNIKHRFKVDLQLIGE